MCFARISGKQVYSYRNFHFNFLVDRFYKPRAWSDGAIHDNRSEYEGGFRENYEEDRESEPENSDDDRSDYGSQEIDESEADESISEEYFDDNDDNDGNDDDDDDDDDEDDEYDEDFDEADTEDEDIENISPEENYITRKSDSGGDDVESSSLMLDLRAERLLKACDDMLSSYDGSFEKSYSPNKPPLAPPQYLSSETVHNSSKSEVRSSLTSSVFQLLPSSIEEPLTVDAAVGTEDLPREDNVSPKSPILHRGSSEIDMLYVSATSLDSLRELASIETSVHHSDERSSIDHDSIVEVT